MLRHLRNRKAQNTAEYAILIALVIGAVVAMQKYVQRTLQGRMYDTQVALRDEGEFEGLNILGGDMQYEPYYSESYKEVDRDSVKQENLEKFSTNALTTTKEGSYVEKTTADADIVHTGAGE